MIIGAAARITGLPAKTIRYYEDIGLVRADRKPNGYRDYSQDQLETLQFVARSRQLGFSIDECRRLLALNADNNRSSSDVKEMTVAHIAEVEAKIRELAEMRATLAALADACEGNQQPDCPIIAYLAGKETAGP